jgi:hypothetical protein
MVEVVHGEWIPRNVLGIDSHGICSVWQDAFDDSKNFGGCP